MHGLRLHLCLLSLTIGRVNLEAKLLCRFDNKLLNRASFDLTSYASHIYLFHGSSFPTGFIDFRLTDLKTQNRYYAIAVAFISFLGSLFLDEIEITLMR